MVGLGHQALEDHLPGLAACDGADLVAVCDADADLVRAQQFACTCRATPTSSSC